MTVIAISTKASCKVSRMRNLPKILAMAVASALSCTAAIGAEPAKVPVKEGWDRQQISDFANACTDGLMNPAVIDYNRAARAKGVTLHKPFPKEAFRESAYPMCLCISVRVSETWTLKEIQQAGLSQAQPMINEALNGGRCKPDGMLGDIRKQKEQAAQQQPKATEKK
ncbi:MAG: hypothetical protein ABUU24_07925 [Variovorax sp.]